MAYKLNITEHADELLDNLVYHLIYRLKNKQAAKHLLDGIDVIYDRLEVNPFQFSECRDVYLARKIRIGHSDRKAWVPFCVLIGLKKKRWCVIIYPKSVVFNNASEVVEMLKNNIEVDVKVKCIEAGKTQTQLAETIGTTGQYVNRIIKKGDGVMNKTFVQMLDAFGV